MGSRIAAGNDTATALPTQFAGISVGFRQQYPGFRVVVSTFRYYQRELHNTFACILSARNCTFTRNMQSAGRQLQQAGPGRAAAVRSTAVCLHRPHRTARAPVVRVAAPEKPVVPISSSDDEAPMTDTTGVLLVQCPGKAPPHLFSHCGTLFVPNMLFPNMNMLCASPLIATLQMPRVLWPPWRSCCLGSTAT